MPPINIFKFFNLKLIYSLFVLSFFSTLNLQAQEYQPVTNQVIDGINITENITLADNPVKKKLIKIVDILGRETDEKGLNIKIYNDGYVEKNYLIN